MSLALSFSLPTAGPTSIEEGSVYCVDLIHSDRARICCNQALVGAVYFNVWCSTGINNVAVAVFLDVIKKIQTHAFVVVSLLLGRAKYEAESSLREMNSADDLIATLCQKRVELAIKSFANATGIDVRLDNSVLVCVSQGGGWYTFFKHFEVFAGFDFFN